jgi:molybdopterin converting factor small subunit
MATVHLPSGLTRHTGGVDTIEIDAARIPELFAALSDRFPPIADELNGVAVAIDGEIYADPGYQPLRADSEVHLLPRIAGG